jgi:hypothetical protein
LLVAAAACLVGDAVVAFGTAPREANVAGHLTVRIIEPLAERRDLEEPKVLPDLLDPDHARLLRKLDETRCPDFPEPGARSRLVVLVDARIGADRVLVVVAIQDGDDIGAGSENVLDSRVRCIHGDLAERSMREYENEVVWVFPHHTSEDALQPDELCMSDMTADSTVNVPRIFTVECDEHCRSLVGE